MDGGRSNPGIAEFLQIINKERGRVADSGNRSRLLKLIDTHKKLQKKFSGDQEKIQEFIETYIAGRSTPSRINGSLKFAADYGGSFRSTETNANDAPGMKQARSELIEENRQSLRDRARSSTTSMSSSSSRVSQSDRRVYEKRDLMAKRRLDLPRSRNCALVEEPPAFQDEDELWVPPWYWCIGLLVLFIALMIGLYMSLRKVAEWNGHFDSVEENLDLEEIYKGQERWQTGNREEIYMAF